MYGHYSLSTRASRPELWARLVSVGARWVYGLLAVFSYHISMFFNEWDWHVKEIPRISGFNGLNLVMVAWLMPLFFVISGMGTHFSLQRRTARDFVKERLVRLGVPLIVGVLLLSPHQVWIERVTKKQFEGSFLQFLPQYFDGLYFISPTGNFAWMGLHLWYLLVVLIYSLATLPFLRPDRPGLWERLGPRIGPLGTLGLPLLALFLLKGFLNPEGLGAEQAGWPFVLYLVFYLLGYSLFPTQGFLEATRRLGPLAVVGGLLTAVPMVLFRPEPPFGTAGYLLSSLMWVVNSWCWLVGLFYLGDRYWNRNSPANQYVNEAVMPFYMLHQPVIVGLAFLMVGETVNPILKYLLLWGASFALIMAIYHFAVRRVGVLRFLFGTK